jgi:DNA (cytosine-5)-methyltransferase 1
MSAAPAILDLFSGACGGWSLGMHRAGFRTIAACEADPWRRAVFAHNFPEARMYDDVRTLTADRIVSECGRLPDVIVGSPPCQDASSANTSGRGLDGERTGLFFHAIRLVRECRPRYAAFENVPGIRTRGVDRVFDALEEIGYACEPFVVGADDVGANHARKRVWFIAFDATSIGHGGWRAWGHGPHGDGAAYPAERGIAADAARYGRANGRCGDWRGLNVLSSAGTRGVAEEHDAGDAAGHGRGQGRPGRRAEPTAGLSVEARRDGAHANGDRQLAGALDAEMGRRAGPGGDVAEPWAGWNGGLAHHLRLDDGLSARLAEHRGLAGAVVSAFGDAVVPQITEAIGRSILRTERALAAIYAAAPAKQGQDSPQAPRGYHGA